MFIYYSYIRLLCLFIIISTIKCSLGNSCYSVTTLFYSEAISLVEKGPWCRLQKTAGYKARRTRVCIHLWGRPIVSSVFRHVTSGKSLNGSPLPRTGTWGRLRPPNRWVDDIRRHGSQDWIRRAQDGEDWNIREEASKIGSRKGHGNMMMSSWSGAFQLRFWRRRCSWKELRKTRLCPLPCGVCNRDELIAVTRQTDRLMKLWHSELSSKISLDNQTIPTWL